MRRKLFRAVAAASLVGTVALGSVVVASPGSSAAPKGRTITLHDRRTNSKDLDLDRNGTFSPGDIDMFTSTEFDGTGRRVGFANVRVTVYFGHVLIEGTVTLTGRGQITFAGADDLDARWGQVAVVGGTGEFRNAHGELRFRSIDENNTRLTIQLTP